jgi:multidrug transporter EmrE-like cation transporter
MSALLLRAGLLVAYVVISVAGMAMIKAAPSLVSSKWAVGFGLYLIGFIIWLGVILRIMPLSQAFPIAAGSLLLGTQVVGWLVLKERFTLPHLAGAVLILAGVALISLTTTATPTGDVHYVKD